MTINVVRQRRRRERGSAIMEFTLVGIGLIFVLIGIFEMSRGMWIYHTLAHTSKEATRYLIVHGRECQSRTNCATDSTLASVAARIRYHGVGLLPNQLELQVWRGGVQVVGSGGGFVTLASLESSATVWDAAAEPGQAVQVSVRYPFRSALAMFWPGAKRVNYTLVTLGANSWDTIQF